MPKVQTKAGEGNLEFLNPVLHREHEKIFSIRNFFQSGVCLLVWFFFSYVYQKSFYLGHSSIEKTWGFVQFTFAIIKSNMKM